ncbi:hypothetical protein EA848_06220 [Vibrio anguillarum]|uniref:hypothetical protein n=2 Tax=Vibrio anguillarum TaxID=55601 RepID=UPI00188DBE04|nr:hypothetical protein [Vibrio anguillarum]MBF4383613.1 hypothetical protein [Vibrio anguillarum]MBF4394472.1 hypothetical protein [Vibrio anguillarum]MBF4429224.1 hypothetical protein [Vibrio anguillarum]
MAKSVANVDTPLSTASLSGTLILGASQLVEAHVPTNYQAVCNVLASTLITYVAIHSTRKIQAYLHKRQVDNTQKEMIAVIDDSINQLDDIIAVSKGDVKKHAEANRNDLMRKKVDVVSGKLHILALDAYVDPHPMHNAEPKIAE